jgi:pyrimidine-nucleoside phosphorylase
MDVKEIILKKQNSRSLSKDEIVYVVNNFISGKISKNDMSDLLRVIYKNKMNDVETYNLTLAMANSGKILKFNNKNEIYADKHSTGGVSDSTTLIIAPIIACAGINFFKMSGRKLGHTGGTIDKLECFKGYKTDIDLKTAETLIRKNRAILISQTMDLAPADKYIYNLRDQIGAVMSTPLIASSVMSKKLAAGADVIVLDVKCGNGAFMKSVASARKLGRVMKSIGEKANKKTCVVITDMNQPLGYNIGSLLETIEAIDVLKGKNGRLRDLSIFLATKIIELGKNISFKEAEKTAKAILNSGEALNKFKEIVKSQGGSLELFDDKIVKKILGSPIIIRSKREGYLTKFDLEKLGNLVRKYCTNNGNKGIKILCQIGSYIKKNAPVIELYGEESNLNFASCLHLSKSKKTADKLIIDVL